MAWKPWYERAAEMNGKEAEEFCVAFLVGNQKINAQ